MTIKTAREKVAQAWATPATSHKVMDVELAEAMADILRLEIGPLEDELERLRDVVSGQDVACIDAVLGKKA